MTIRALIVEDDVAIRESVGDIVVSMGHEFDVAGSQTAARALLNQSEFDYILLDLEIPVRDEATFARPENGENLLAEMRRQPTTKGLPVIVMTAHGSDGPDLGVKQMKLGATDFVNKPFDGGCLDRAIREALERDPGSNARSKNGSHIEIKRAGAVRPFTGGRLMLSADAASLCCVIIVERTERGYAWPILQLLCETNAAGTPRPYSGQQIASTLGRRITQNTVSQCIRGLRKRITKALREQVNVECGNRDVIVSGGPGYRLNDWIEVRAEDDESAGSSSVAGDAGTISLHEAADEHEWNERQQWILERLRSSSEVRRCDIEKHFRCSPKTAKRDLADLRERDLVEFVRTPWPGHYRLADPSPEPSSTW
ncbi:MAG: response regulator [Phycisphaerales bacterium]